MKKIHNWKNHKIQVFSRAVAKHLWCTVSLGVVIDGNKMYQSPDSFRIKGSIKFEIEEDGNAIQCQLISIPPSSVIYSRYKLVVGNSDIYQGGVRAENWYILYGLMTILCVYFVSTVIT
ncbi:hypothetical protein BTA51_28700 [Hahella sp. CCB-MM4]|uniref:hypothetical protein n=1 Tax=Hahella sp. (strain CCB-MM4) TaxID=1926491 RepID=UPI000B9B094D|nr:hypothetical protein [Hahella sp. CCB-MM4]OZG69917.1 hypothetical protein BTA51_28700 [Hahella sp. CCB-MM4]